MPNVLQESPDEHDNHPDQIGREHSPAVLLIKKNLDRAELELALEANRRGIPIHVISTSTCPGKERLTAAGIFTEIPSIRSKFSPRLILTIRRLVKRLGITVIHAPDSSSLANAIWATYFLKVRIIAYRGTMARIRRSDPTFWLGILHPRVSRVICVSTSVYEHMQHYLPADKLRLIYKGYREEWLTEQGATASLPASIPDDAIIIMYIAATRGRPYKGLAILIEAMNLLECSHAHMIFIGSHDPMVFKTAQETRHPERLHFLGEIPQAASYLHHADMYVLPSLREGLPRSIKEAMACGLPVVATNIPGPAELVSHNETGLLVEPGSAHALAGALDILCANESLRRQMGENGKKRLVEIFGTDQYIEKTLELYREASR